MKHKKVTWLELFYDLLFVAAVSKATHIKLERNCTSYTYISELDTQRAFNCILYTYNPPFSRSFKFRRAIAVRNTVKVGFSTFSAEITVRNAVSMSV